MIGIKNKRLKSLLIQLFCLMIGLLVIFPICYALIASLKPGDILTYPPKLFPSYMYLGKLQDSSGDDPTAALHLELDFDCNHRQYFENCDWQLMCLWLYFLQL